jgi:alanyl-tRNA synthetase
MDKDTRTERLYLKDSYATSFKASLLSCEKDENGRIVAVLDRTCFYPESGGQPSDRGTIAGVGVIDVWEDDSGAVYHQLDGSLEPGEVECRIDWDRRFDHMQQHTGQHVLSRSFIDVCGKETVSFHLGEDICTIDLDGKAASDEDIEKAEALANSILWENRGVLVRTGPPGDMPDSSLRKSLPEGVDEVRLVEIDGFDTVGCCGTHVRRAGELGIVKVLKREKAKGADRIFFVVGKRAFYDLSAKHDITKRLAKRFTTSVESLEDKIDKLASENQRFRKDAQKSAKKLAGFEAERLRGEAIQSGDRRYVVEVVADASEEFLRHVASHLKSTPDTVGLLGSGDGLVICVASAGIDIDFTGPVVERAKSVGGSGGGKGSFATARLPESVAPSRFLQEVFEDVRDG